MRYSLLSRFQGALWGAALGEELGLYSLHRSQTNSECSLNSANYAALRLWKPGCLDASQPLPAWGNIAALYTKTLVRSRSRDLLLLKELRAIDSRANGAIAANGELDRPAQPSALTRLAIAVPVALFFHDDDGKLRQFLKPDDTQLDQPMRDGALAVGFAIAQALKEQLNPMNLIPQTITYLQQSASATSSSLIDPLEQVQTLLQQGHGLDTVMTRLQIKPEIGAHTVGCKAEAAIALGFYCFLSTPDDLELAVLRAAQVIPSICAFTAALAGAYNSTAGIPLAWSMAVNLPLTSWGLSGADVCQLGSQLFARWSGVWDGTFLGNAPAIAAPGVIRPG